MLTVRFDELGVQPGDLLLDLGCGAGRHAFEAFRLGARVVAFDYSAAELKDVGGLFAAMRDAGEAGTAPGPTPPRRGEVGSVPRACPAWPHDAGLRVKLEGHPAYARQR